MPMGAYGATDGVTLRVAGMMASPDGAQCFRANVEGPSTDAETLGHRLAQAVLDQGATALLTGGTA